LFTEEGLGGRKASDQFKKKPATPPKKAKQSFEKAQVEEWSAPQATNRNSLDMAKKATAAMGSGFQVVQEEGQKRPSPPSWQGQNTW